MTWVRVDDQFPFHPKVLGLSLEAIGLWTVGLCYANLHLTDGEIPEGLMRLYPGAESAVRELVSRGLWRPFDGQNGSGFRVHDYLEYQPSKDDVRGKREKDAERLRVWRDGKRGETPVKRDRNKNVRYAPTPTPTPKKIDTDFELFWGVYPRHVKKADAQKAFAKAVLVASAKDIIEGARRYRDDPARDPKFTAHPTTWLNGGRWEDEFGFAATVNDVRDDGVMAMLAKSEAEAVPMPDEVKELVHGWRKP